MPLAPYQYRPTTPPAADVPALIEGSSIGHTRNLSGDSICSAASSPDSLDIHIRTPISDRSPVRGAGPTLLPKIRTQDQSYDGCLEPPTTMTKSHRRCLSQQPNPPAHPIPRHASQRSVTVPPECNSIISPTSATSTNFSSFDGNLSSTESPVTLTPSWSRKSHYRSSSASSIDSSTLRAYAYPTYRQRPTGNPQQAYWCASSTPGSSTFVPPPTYRSYQPQHYDLPEEMLFHGAEEETMTSAEYLRATNPAIDLVRLPGYPAGNGIQRHYWWDIRNLATWSDFSMQTVSSIPSFPELLDIPINVSAFPTPQLSASRLRPETEANLVETIRDFYAVKLNAALKVTQGQHRCLRMRIGLERDGPTFVSSYPTDDNDDSSSSSSSSGSSSAVPVSSIPGQAAKRRARVVGVVRSYERWNSGLRRGNGADKVRYLEGLALLHRHMRDAGTRYGFIMTETELVIARAGTTDVPFFGHLELAAPIETRRCGKAAKGTAADGGNLTAMMGLWFLHMLAKEEPLPGQVGWRMSVGLPAAMTRRNVLPEKDDWIPAPQTGEKRKAKRDRGWVMPEDPWDKKREGGGRRRT